MKKKLLGLIWKLYVINKYSTTIICSKNEN